MDITKCKKCGGDIIADEIYTWGVTVDDEDKTIHFNNAVSEIDKIYCQECGDKLDYPDDYQFNFN